MTTKPVAADDAVELVTLESAHDAIDHVSLHNGPGRDIEAKAMLVKATVQQIPAQVQVAHEEAIKKVVGAFSAYGNAVGANNNARMTEAVMKFDDAVAALRTALFGDSLPSPHANAAKDREVIERMAASSSLDAYAIGEMWSEAAQTAPTQLPLCFAYLVEKAARAKEKSAELASQPQSADTSPNTNSFRPTAKPATNDQWQSLLDVLRRVVADGFISGPDRAMAATFLESLSSAPVRWLMPDGTCTQDRNYGEHYGGEPLFSTILAAARMRQFANVRVWTNEDVESVEWMTPGRFVELDDAIKALAPVSA